MSTCNVIPTTISCASFADSWTCLHDCNHCCYRQHQWILTPDHVTATTERIEDDTKDEQTSVRRVLTENNAKKGNTKYVHVPHRDKPPQVVAKRNARERRRVQAVNNAFSRLRKAVPLENNRYFVRFIFAKAKYVFIHVIVGYTGLIELRTRKFDVSERESYTFM